VGEVARSAGLVSHERGNSDVTPPAGVVPGYVIARESANREVGFSTQSAIL
jgi:hypothetical protein